jgi:hypothetical protein
MTKNNPQESTDEFPSGLRKALIECGALIPTTPEEVLLAERQLKIRTTREQIKAAFSELERALDDPTAEISFARLDDSVSVVKNQDLAMAARNGMELGDETRAKIEDSVDKALRKPQQGK